MRDSEQSTPSASFGLIRVHGRDAKKFLQGQLTCNLDEVHAEHSRLGAHCNPQGRVLFLFRIFEEQEGYYLVLPGPMAAPALHLLKKYAIFFKLELRIVEEELPPHLDERARQEWRFFDLSQGIPQIYPETSALFLPHDLRLHELQGLSWDKGCYTGQEIIARMHYKGKLKNHLSRAQIHTKTQPHRGAEVYLPAAQGGKPAGFIVDYRTIRYNSLYELLVLTTENNRASLLTLDPLQNETWEWLNEHG